jgi:hypothetical protein
MSLTLTCQCGTRFEVDETFGGHEVTCPQCQAPVKAPAPTRVPVHTSDWAIASLVLALVGAFTVVGTASAIVLGIIAIVRIQRNRERQAGMGYAVTGIVLGAVFTGLTLLAITTGEVFGIGEQIRERQLAGRLRDDPDLEVEQGDFHITRVSHDWAVAKPELKRELQSETDLLLVHKRRDAYLDVEAVGLKFMSAESFADQLLEQYRKQGRESSNTLLPKLSEVKLRDKTILPSKNGEQRVEMLVGVHVLGQPWNFLVRVVMEENGRTYVISGRAHVHTFKKVEDDMRRMMDSFGVR